MISPSKPVNVLLVDDRSENLLALESLLQDEPIQVHKARSGQEALDLMLAHDFCLAMIDVQMPEMNGFELAEFMRGTALTKHIPIVFVTAGNRSQQNVFKGYESGAVDFLYKPLDSLVVKSKVRVFIQLREQSNLLQARLKSVEDAFEALKSTEAELQRAIQVRDDFLSIASHELKTPMTPLKFQIQNLLRVTTAPESGPTIPVEKVSNGLKKAEAAVNRIQALIENLLDVTGITSGQLALHQEEMDLSDVVKDVIDRYSDSIKISGSTFQISLESGVTVRADRLRVEQILTNLLTNSKKYAPGVPIHVSVKRDNGKALLLVRDEGPGISEAAQCRIFNRFERATNASSISGLGLGLYISRQIAKAHGGDIELESKLGKGCQFTVSIPLFVVAPTPSVGPIASS